MKRITVFLVLSVLISILIGCGGGGGGSREVTISISPKEVTLLLGEEEKFTATVTGLSDQRVTWSATGGEIDDNGRYLATEVGTFEVIATSKADPSKKAKAKVTVVDPEWVKAFKEIKAWQGSITWRINASWSSTDEAGQEFNHQCQEDVTLEYRLEDKGYYIWWRKPETPIMVLGSIHNRSDKAPGDKFYMETKWRDQFSFVPESGAKTDYLDIHYETGTYSIYLEGQSLDPSPIVTKKYESGDLVETWKNWGFPTFFIENQPLPEVGKTLSGSEVKKISVYPLWYGPGADVPTEANMTITWRFVPIE